MNIEAEFQKCVEQLGGERVSQTFGESPKFEDADFIFKSEGIISELKSLDEDKIADEKYIEKASELYLKELSAGKAPVVVFGTVNMSTQGFSDEFTRAIIDLYKKPIQNSIKKANRQIRDTKKAFEQPNFKGLFVIANNNHSALSPWHANFILEEILRKPDYSNINTAIYMSGAKTAIFPHNSTEVGVWIVKHRANIERISESFLEKLRQSWFSHFAGLKGHEVHSEIQADAKLLAMLENKNA